MNVSHQTTEQLKDNQRRTRHAESYGKTILGQRLLDAFELELSRRAQQGRQCGGDCGDCNANKTALCASCSNNRCCIEDRSATACVEHRTASA